jgi:signal transduction histidine kinase
MLALVDTLSLPLDEDERETTMQQMRAEIDAMRELIEDMMLLTRLESEGVPDGGPTDVSAAVEACVKRHRTAAAAAGLTLTGGAPPGLSAGVSERLVVVVLDNLVENAIRHAGEGAEIDVRARGLGGAVELAVADTGAGVPAEHMQRIFERFHRVEGSRTGPGTGLGLAIVKHIAESHGGRAVMESVEGEGTTVRVIVPAAVQAESPIPQGSDPERV